MKLAIATNQSPKITLNFFISLGYDPMSKDGSLSNGYYFINGNEIWGCTTKAFIYQQSGNDTPIYSSLNEYIKEKQEFIYFINN